MAWRTVSKQKLSTDCSCGYGRAILRGRYMTTGRRVMHPGLSTGCVDPPAPHGRLAGTAPARTSFIEFGMKPFGQGENGGIKGTWIYA